MPDEAFAPVGFSVLGIERVRSGTLVGLAIVEMDIGGIVVQLQGVQVLQTRGGGFEVRAPRFRDGQGVWRSAIVLPDTLRDALGDECLSVFNQMNCAN